MNPWVIDFDVFSWRKDTVQSADYVGQVLPARFRIRDDDGEVYAYGRMAIRDLHPLDDYGKPNWGATELQVLNDYEEWETL